MVGGGGGVVGRGLVGETPRPSIVNYYYKSFPFMASPSLQE